MRQVDDIIVKIYDAAVDPAKWPGVLEHISQFMDARGAIIFALESADGSRRLVASHICASYDTKLVEDYLKQHKQQELLDQERFALFSRGRDDIELVPDEVLAASPEEFLARPNVQMMRKMGVHYRSGALLNKDDVYRDRFSMQFSRGHGPLTAENAVKSAQILPHVAKALNVNRPAEQLFEKYRCVFSCLDLLKVGICVLSKDGAVIVKNKEFTRQLECYDVFRLGPTGRLMFNRRELDQSVRQLLSGITNHGHFGARPRKEAVVAVLDSEDYRLCVEVAPLSASAEFGSRPLSAYILYSLDTSLPFPINVSILRELFGLTDTESEVLGLMAEGLTNREISERRDKSVETINSQAKSLLAKTVTANRTQLIRLATNLSANFLSEPIT
jgi:DNA-binding CsgD family transcriptional regulator